MKYQAEWIVTKFTYYDQDLYDNLKTINCQINISEKRMVFPTLESSNSREFFKDHNFDVFEEKNRHFLIFNKSNLFNDTFEIKCDVDCCKIILFNQSTNIELIYNSDLNLIKTRIKCPNAGIYLDSLWKD